MGKFIDATGLAEITTVRVDKDLPQRERCAEFRRQIRDMENYKCTTENGTFTIKAVYAKNGATVEDCLRGIVA